MICARVGACEVRVFVRDRLVESVETVTLVYCHVRLSQLSMLSVLMYVCMYVCVPFGQSRPEDACG